MNASDSLPAFLAESLKRNPETGIATHEIIKRYATYCTDRGWGVPTEGTIQKNLPDLMMAKFGVRPTKHVKGFIVKEVRGYNGVDWI
jgi:hypothetical protein